MGAHIVDGLLHLANLQQEGSQAPGCQRAASSGGRDLQSLHSDYTLPSENLKILTAKLERYLYSIAKLMASQF